MLCSACLELANTSYKFQQQCNRSQVILETYLTQTSADKCKNLFCNKGKQPVLNVEPDDSLVKSKSIDTVAGYCAKINNNDKQEIEDNDETICEFEVKEMKIKDDVSLNHVEIENINIKQTSLKKIHNKYMVKNFSLSQRKKVILKVYLFIGYIFI